MRKKRNKKDKSGTRDYFKGATRADMRRERDWSGRMRNKN